MRILTTPTKGDWGGAEIHTVALSRTLAERGHAVSIVELGHDLYDHRWRGERPVQIVRVNISRHLSILTVRDWIRIFQPMRDTVCILPKGNLDSGSWHLDVAARFSFRHFATIEHLACPSMPSKSRRKHLGGILPGVGLWWYRVFASRWMRSLGPQRIICVSDSVRDRLVQHYHFPFRKMVTVRNGIDLQVFQCSIKARTTLRRTWGIREDAFVFGAMGRLHEQKGYDIAIEAFQQLVSTMPTSDTHLVLIGEGRLRESLSRAAQRAGIQDRFLLLDFTERPWEALSSFDVFLLPSRNEGLPLVLLEAMACGCCPIATRVGGVPEILTDISLGWLVDAEDASQLSRAMRSAVLAPPAVLSDMRHRAGQRVRAHFDARVQYARLAEVLERDWRQQMRHAVRQPLTTC